MEIREVYKKVLKNLKQAKEQGKVAYFRGQQLYFTALVMGIVARKDQTYEDFKTTELAENHREEYKQGIIDAEKIVMSENILFEAMSYNDEITRMPLAKETKNE